VLLDSIADMPTALVVATHDPAVSRRMQTVWHMQHGRLFASGAC
jgi:ABC-type lipoprotein export system ATPase subunit